MSSSADETKASAEPPELDPEPSLFCDDDPVLRIDMFPLSVTSAGLPKVTVQTILESPSVISSASCSGFPLLVKLKAPSMSDYQHPLQRAPIDLVIVLDTSDTVSGSKLDQMKKGVEFVIDNLTRVDRLSIVSFSTDARRLVRLCRMNPSGQEKAKHAVRSLVAEGSTNIVGGLAKGAKVLVERRERNTVARIIFMSATRDNCYCTALQTTTGQSQTPEYLNLLPRSIYPRKGETEDGLQRYTFPVYTLGIDSYHDPWALRAISDSSSGIYSFIDRYELMQDALASCIGGLLSVVAQEISLVIFAASPCVKIEAITSGRHYHNISVDGLKGKLNIADLYADEEKHFLIRLTLPQLLVLGGESERETFLADITCCYTDEVSNESVLIRNIHVHVDRPSQMNPASHVEDIEFKRQRSRLQVEEIISKAVRLAETDDLAKAKTVLSADITHFIHTKDVINDQVNTWLLGELSELERRMANQDAYEMKGGRAYALASLSLHAYQRATVRGVRVPGEEDIFAVPRFKFFTTPNMGTMVAKSREKLD